MLIVRKSAIQNKEPWNKTISIVKSFKRFYSQQHEKTWNEWNGVQFSVSYDAIDDSDVVNNQPWIIRPLIIDLNPDERSYYPFIISIDWCHGSFHIAEDPCGRACVPNKTEDVNLRVFNIIKEINESKSLVNHISCRCKCKFDGRKFHSKQKVEQW